MKVMTIVGTRPELIKLSRVIPALDAAFDHVLVHTGQNWDPTLHSKLFAELGLRAPDRQVYCGYGGPIASIASILKVVDDSLTEYKPDAVLILGDTNSAVAAAYAAKRRHISIFHMEAGNRCFDDRTPEEVNRRIIDHIADINMPCTEHARRNLLAEGVPPDRIIKTGSPMLEVLRHYEDAIDASPILAELKLHWSDYYVVSCHREENVDDPDRLRALVDMVNSLQGRVVFSLHPRTYARLYKAKYLFKTNVSTHAPFGFFDYCQLQSNARCVISDSGTLTEESALRRFPAVQLRQAHERPEGADHGTTIMADFPNALTAVDIAASYKSAGATVPEDYCVPDVSERVVRTILSYTDYVKRRVYYA